MLGNMFWLKNKSLLLRIGIYLLLLLGAVTNSGKSAQKSNLITLDDRICKECTFFNGEGVLSFFGLKIYRAALFSKGSSGKIFDSKFALQIKYLRNLSGEDIAKRSLREMKSLNIIPKGRENEWDKWMRKHFPDIKSGDILTGVYIPGQKINLFHNGVLVASKEDRYFSKSFFLIWLDEETSEPKLREKLIQLRHND